MVSHAPWGGFLILEKRVPVHEARQHVRHMLQGGGSSAAGLSHGAPTSAETAPDEVAKYLAVPDYPTVSERTGTAGRATSRPAAMRGQAMAAGVVPASVTAYASSRSRFLGARLERARRRERVRACARFQPRTGERSSRVPRVFADAESGSDVPASGSSKLPSQKIPPLYVKRTVRSSTVRHPGTIVVMGDVDAESSVIAGGDVFVWGSLRGSVIAGQGGDYKAKVSALDMRPSSLQIGSVKGNVKRGADGDPVLKASGVPETATVEPTSRQRLLVQPASAAAAELSRRADVGLAKSQRVTSAAVRRAAYFTGIYIAAAGVALMVAPDPVFSLLFNVQAITEGWIRVFGVLCVAFGVYYFGTAYGDGKGLGARAFYLSTVVGRVFIFASFLFMVACGLFKEPGLLILGVINLLGALAMMFALSKKKTA